MILQTGGSAFGEISTKSNPSSSASSSAFLVGYIPTSTLSPTSLTLSILILELILCRSVFSTRLGVLLFRLIAMASKFN